MYCSSTESVVFFIYKINLFVFQFPNVTPSNIYRDVFQNVSVVLMDWHSLFRLAIIASISFPWTSFNLLLIYSELMYTFLF